MGYRCGIYASTDSDFCLGYSYADSDSIAETNADSDSNTDFNAYASLYSGIFADSCCRDNGQQRLRRR